MKYITKRRQPYKLIAWTRAKLRDERKLGMTWNYDDMPSPVRQSVKVNLIQEQGGLCCYTGRKITLKTSHIEHLKPKSSCTGHEDTKYVNLLAAYPSANAHKECPYGAHAKKNWYERRLFVHPLRRDCETRFRYRFNGKMTPQNASDSGSLETICRLRLNHLELQEMRQAAIHSALFEQELTRSQVQRLMDAMDNRDGNDCFREFCFVIKQACKEHMARRYRSASRSR